MKNNTFEFASLEFLSDYCDYYDDLFNPFLEFKTLFTTQYKACLLTKWTYNQRYIEPYVCIDYLGVFTSLDTLATRIINELNSLNETKLDPDSFDFRKYNIKLSVEFFNDCLTISLPRFTVDGIEIDYWKEFRITFIDIDEIDDKKYYKDGIKFDYKMTL